MTELWLFLWCMFYFAVFRFVAAVFRRVRRTRRALTRAHVTAEHPSAAILPQTDNPQMGAFIRVMVVGLHDPEPHTDTTTLVILSFDQANQLLDTFSDIGYEVIIEGKGKL